MSTAKSMANQYLSAKRAAGAKSNTLSPLSSSTSSSQYRFKSSTSNLLATSSSNSNSRSRSVTNGLKATSMTNLASEHTNQRAAATRLQRPASRNALDSIHNGMNAKYAQVQSKVLLQNIRPQQPAGQQTRIPASKTSSETLSRRTAASHVRSTPSPVKAPNERSAMINKLKSLQEELDKSEQERESARVELEQERTDKQEQVQQLKLELQEKIAEHDKQNEEYHQKLLEAYELADQNRRAADQVLSESRQRGEEWRKKIEELEAQLSELKEFVSMKEEMTDKMYELKEQIREERQRYEEQLKSLHQVFENEKISKNQVFKDQNSNYFSRIKPSLEASSESISANPARGGCKKCQSGSSQLHKSEQDIYGSKLSTRMHDTAKSAWKSSKKFASSVITGGVSLTGCRRKGASSCDLNSGKRVQLQPQLDLVDRQQQQQEDEQHTSVVQVNSSPSSGVNVEIEQQQQDPSLTEIRKDASNKLTIVTKFNDDQLMRHQGHASSSKGNSPAGHSLDMAAPPSSTSSSSSSSERSRCESSSSGRGTSSDAGSAASQNGDDKEEQQHQPDLKITSGESEIANLTQTTTATATATDKKNKRRSSSSALFKASKVVFGGSQVSLNKLKNFFNGGGGGKQQLTKTKQSTDKPNNQEVAAAVSATPEADAENSRLRCMELNQAIKMPSISAPSTTLPNEPAKVVVAQVEPEQVAGSEVGQGDEEESEPAATTTTTVVVCQLEADLVEKVRQVGEHYELNKYKTLNKTIELDARLANERLLATKLRLNQVNSMNDKLMKQLRSLQQDFRSQEKKLLLTETMLRQLIDTKDPAASRRAQQQQQLQSQQPTTKETTTSRVGRAAGRLSKFGRSQTTAAAANLADGKPSTVSQSSSSNRQRPPATCPSPAAASANYNNNNNNDLVPPPPTSVAAATGLTASDAGKQQQRQAGRQVSISSAATQTQTAPSRTRSIINDLRQRLNLAGNSSRAPSNKRPDNGQATAGSSSGSPTKGLLDEAVQTQQQQQQPALIGDSTTVRVEDFAQVDDQYIYYSEDEDAEDAEHRRHLLDVAAGGGGRRRSISLNDILATSFVHEAATGEQIIVSRGWPVPRSSRRRARSSSRHPQVRLRSRLNETQKRKLLMQFLDRQQQPTTSSEVGKSLIIQSKPSDVRSAMRLRNAGGQQQRQPGVGRRASVLKLNVRRVGSGRKDNQQPKRGVESSKRPTDDDERLAATGRSKTPTTTTTRGKSLTVQYDLPTTDGRKPIALGLN